jgi:hypothetical protein
MGPNRLRATVVVCALLGPYAQAGELWTWTNSAVGEGLAQVFDGGPPVTHSVDLQGTTASFLAFRATDDTGPGSLAAVASANGASRVGDFGQNMRVLVDFDAYYAASLFPGGDRPGGRAEGTFTSIVDFVMPVDQLEWFYGLGMGDAPGFTGSTNVTVVNITSGQTLLTLGSVMEGDTILAAHAGDLIRITSEMSGGGEAPGELAIDRGYGALLDMIFTIPEPGTFTLLALGAVVALRRRRS